VNTPTFSFEFFPPKTKSASKKLQEDLPELIALEPKFMTVTYGTGGTTKDTTPDTINQMMAISDIPVASHLTFIDTTKEELKKYVSELWDKGIHHIVALRGDMPKGLQWPLDNDNNYYQYTSDFVGALREWYPQMEISVGAYPEKHPDAPSVEADIMALKAKCDAGATRAITQFFFDNEQYYRFVDKCKASGIRIPIVPGLLPIHDFKGMCNFAKRCQANVSLDLYSKFESVENKPEEAEKLAIELLTTQVEDLVNKGIKHIHFYTLNKSDITKDVIKALF
jgi:methylenetetrahydrofolate reductase (NADPH)